MIDRHNRQTSQWLLLFSLCSLAAWLVLSESARFGLVYAQSDPSPAASAQSSGPRSPRNLRATVVGANSVRLEWRPVDADGQRGRYEVAAGAALDATLQPTGIVPDLTTANFLVENLEPGTVYRFAVRAVLETDQGERAGPTVFTYATTPALDDQTLLLVYFPADNDLSPYVDGVLRRIQRGSAANPGVHTLFLVDRWGPDNTQLYEVAGGVITPTTVVEDVWGVQELDSTDPAVLTWFLNYGREHVAAARTVVSLMGHGTGWLPHADLPDLTGPDLPPVSQDGIPALPRGIEATPGDVNDGGAYMSTVALGRALAAATDDGADPFDLIFFDQCFQGNLDVLYEVHPYARVFVASPNYAWLSAPYHYYLPALAPGATPEFMARIIISAYQRSLNDFHPNAIFWLRGSQIPVIAAAADTLADALLTALANNQTDMILQAAESAQYVDTTQCGPGLYELGPPDEKVGLFSFATQLGQRFGPGDIHGVTEAAQAVRRALNDVQISARTGRPYLNLDTFWNYTDSLTVLAPLARESGATTAWRASTYTRTVPFQADWPLDASVSVEVTAATAYVQSGRWADFIAAWYTDSLSPSLGEWCLYTPPPQVGEPEPDTIALSVQAEGDNTVRLSWTAADLAETDVYWVFATRPGQVGFRLVATLPGNETSVVISLPPGESYEFQLSAQDELGFNLARSNAAVFTPDTQPQPASLLFVPWLDR